MKPEYENVTFTIDGANCLSFKNNNKEIYVYNIHDIAPRYQNLIAAAPVMYGTLDAVCNNLQRLTEKMDELSLQVDAHSKTIFASMSAYVQEVQNQALHAMHLADIGILKLVEEFEAQRKSNNHV